MANRIRVLALDDDPARHAWLKLEYPAHEVVPAFTYYAVLGRLREQTWDILHLDHDLAEHIKDGIYPDMGPGMFGEMPYNGRDVVAWLLEHGDRCPKHIVIHSWSDHAITMEQNLRQGYAQGKIPNLRSIARKQAPV